MEKELTEALGKWLEAVTPLERFLHPKTFQKWGMRKVSMVPW